MTCNHNLAAVMTSQYCRTKDNNVWSASKCFETKWKSLLSDLVVFGGSGSVKTGSDRKPENERTLLDNASNLLTNLLSGGNMGTMPIAEGAVSDLFGRPLFFALYDWFMQVSSAKLCAWEMLTSSGYQTMQMFTSATQSRMKCLVHPHICKLVSASALESRMTNMFRPPLWWNVQETDDMELMWTCFCFWCSTGQCTSLPLDQKHLWWSQILLSLVTSSVRTHLLMTRSFQDFTVPCFIFAYLYHESLSRNYELGINLLQSFRWRYPFFYTS